MSHITHARLFQPFFRMLGKKSEPPVAIEPLENQFAYDLWLFHIKKIKQLATSENQDPIWSELNSLYEKLSLEVINAILFCHDVRSRSKKIKFFLNVATQLIGKNEYFFAHSIYGALNSPMLTRLNYVSDYLKHQRTYKEINKLFDISDNNRNYRIVQKDNLGLPLWPLFKRDQLHLNEVARINCDDPVQNLLIGLEYKYQNIDGQFLTSIIQDYQQSHHEEEQLWRLSYLCKPKCFKLEQSTYDQILVDLKHRLRTATALEYSYKKTTRSGKQALQLLFSFLIYQYQQGYFTYEQCGEILNASKGVLNVSGHKIDTNQLMNKLAAYAVFTSSESKMFSFAQNNIRFSRLHISDEAPRKLSRSAPVKSALAELKLEKMFSEASHINQIEGQVDLTKRRSKTV